MGVDLLPLIPDKFHDSDLLNALVEVLNERVDSWIEDITALQQLQDPHNVPAAYLQYLADQIGFALTSADDMTTAGRRNELLQAIDWYKVKGTYQSLSIIALWMDLTFIIYDMYTNDYSTFVDQEWFVGEENENPSGLDSTYYKSPHFGLCIVLDKIYVAGTYDEGAIDKHLWRPSLFADIDDWVEKTRPVNTVPHYQILHTCVTDESLTAYEIADTETITRIVGTWTYSNIFFDGAALGSANQIYFDDGDYFDSDFETFIATITTWKLATCANYGINGGGCLDLSGDIPSGGLSLDTILLTGTVDSYTIYDDRIEFEFVVPQATELDEINEVGLYVGSELMIASTFPDINKGDGTLLKVKVIVYRTLSL